jgi:hypothetical protein
MNTFVKIIGGIFLSSVLSVASNVGPCQAAAVQGAGDQVQKPDQATQTAPPASNYANKLSRRNTAAKRLSERNKAANPKPAEAVKNNNGSDTPQLSKRNQAVIDKNEAATKKRDLVNKINADRPQK